MDVGREDFIRNRVMQVAFSILQTSTLAFFSFSFPFSITNNAVDVLGKS